MRKIQIKSPSCHSKYLYYDHLETNDAKEMLLWTLNTAHHLDSLSLSLCSRFIVKR